MALSCDTGCDDGWCDWHWYWPDRQDVPHVRSPRADVPSLAQGFEMPLSAFYARQAYRYLDALTRVS